MDRLGKGPGECCGEHARWEGRVLAEENRKRVERFHRKKAERLGWLPPDATDAAEGKRITCTNAELLFGLKYGCLRRVVASSRSG